MTREPRKRIRDVGTNCLSTYITTTTQFLPNSFPTPPRSRTGTNTENAFARGKTGQKIPTELQIVILFSRAQPSFGNIFQLLLSSNLSRFL